MANFVFREVTLNAEDGSNLLTLPFTAWLPMAIGTPGGAYEDGAWNSDIAPTYTDRFDTNTRLATVRFHNSTTTSTGGQHLYRQFALPTDCVVTAGSMSARVFFFSTSTGGNVVFQLATSFTADDTSLNPAWNTAATVTQAQKAANLMNVATITSLSMTGAASGSMMNLDFYRDPNHASDTSTGHCEVFGVELTYRRAI